MEDLIQRRVNGQLDCLMDIRFNVLDWIQSNVMED